MQIKFEDGIIIFIDNDKEYSFESHGNYLNSFIKYDLIDREKHRLREYHDGETGKISKVEDVAIGNNRAAWYVQDYLPDGENYKRSKKAIITLGDFVSGEERVIYKGECFGDLCFDGDDLYFNASKDGQTCTFVIESYLCGPDTDVYRAVKKLNVGDTIDIEGFLYWYEGAQPHITHVEVDS